MGVEDREAFLSRHSEYGPRTPWGFATERKDPRGIEGEEPAARRAAAPNGFVLQEDKIAEGAVFHLTEEGPNLGGRRQKARGL